MKKTAALALIFAAALALRVWPIIHSPETVKHGMGQYGDTNYYHRIAFNLQAGHGYSAVKTPEAYGIGVNPPGITYEPAVTRGPVYPYFLSFVYRFAGDRRDMLSVSTWHHVWDRARLAQSVLDASLCLAVFLIVRCIYPASRVPAFLAAGLHAMNIYSIFYARALVSETVTAFALAWALFFYLRALRDGGILRWAVAGAAWGAVILSRFEYAPYAFFLCLLSLWARKATRVQLRNAAVFGLAAACVLLPWQIRLSRVLEKPRLTPISYVGYTLYHGTWRNHDDWVDWGKMPAKIFRSEEEKLRVEALSARFNETFYAGRPEVMAIDKEFRKLALERIRRDPATVIRNWLRNIPHLWFQHTIRWSVYPDPPGHLFIVYFALAALAVAFAGGAERVYYLPGAILFVYLTLLFLPLHVEPRYSVPAMPVIGALAGVGFFRALQRLKVLK